MTAPQRPETICYRRSRAVALAALLLLLAGTTVGVLVPAGLGWDFANFYDAGRRAAAGDFAHLYDPSSPIAGAAPQGALQFWGTPLSALFYIPLSYFTAPTALLVFKVQNTVAYFAALGLLFTHLRRFVDSSAGSQWRFAAVFTTLSLLYQPFWTVYRVGGQTTPTVFLLLVVALLAHMAGRDALTALLLVLVVAIKPALALMFGFLVALSGIRFLVLSAAISLAVAGAALQSLGWEVHREFLGLMLHGASLSVGWHYNSSLYVPFENIRLLPEFTRLSGAGAAVSAAIAALKLGVVMTLAFLVWRSRRFEWSERARRHFVFLMAALFFLLVSHLLWEHYLSVLFLLLGYVWACRASFSRAAMALMVAIAIASLGQNFIVVDYVRHRFTFDSVPAAAGIGVLKAAPLLLTLIFLWRHGRELLRSYTAPAWAGR